MKDMTKKKVVRGGCMHCPGNKVEFDTPICLNVSVAGSIVMYDRKLKTQ